MKKIFRMALVFALAGATLLYTSCTKDYSPDLSEIQDQVDDLKSDLNEALTTLEGVKGDISGLKSADNALQGKIDDLNAALDKAIKDLKDEIKKGDDAVKGYVDAEILKVKGLIDGLANDLEALEGRVGTLEGKVGTLEGKVGTLEGLVDDLQKASETLGGLFETYAKFIQSIAYVPATSEGEIVAYPYNLIGGGKTQNVLVASFKVTPADAVSRVTEESASLVAVETKAAAAAPDTLDITKLVYRDDAPGYVDVYAVLPENSSAIALAVSQVENTLLESVTSDYAQVTVGRTQNLRFDLFDGETLVQRGESVEEAPVRVSPSSETDSVKVFTEGRWVVKALVEGEYYTPEELQEIFDVPSLASVSPLPNDTIVEFYGINYSFTYENSNDGFNTAVWPQRPITIVDIINSVRLDQRSVEAYVNNSHLRGYNQSGSVIGTYYAVPDTVKSVMTPLDPVVIAWDYKNYNNIADTTIKNVAVPENVIDNIVTPSEITNINTVSGKDYTETRPQSVLKADLTHVHASIYSNAEYGVADSTYTFTSLKYNPADGTIYSGSFDYVVEARPADLVINLGSVDTLARTDNKTAFKNLNVVAAILNVQGDAYARGGQYNLANVANDLKGALAANLDSLVVLFNGAKITPSAYTFSYDNGEFGYTLDKVGTYTFKMYDNAYGVKYEYDLTVNTSKNVAKIAPKATFVTLDNAQTKDYSVQVKGDYDGSFHYYLVDQHLKDYFKVVDYSEDSENLMVASALATPQAAGKVVAVTPNNPTALERLVENPEVANLEDLHTYSWADYDSLQFKVATTLVAEADNDFTVDSVTVRLWTVDPIPVFSADSNLVALHEKDQYATADLFAALTVQDLNGYNLVGKVGDQYKLLNADGVTVFDYDQELTIGEPELVSGADYIEELRLSVNGSVLRLELNQGTIVTPIVVKVPVTLTYMLDQGLGNKNTVEVYVTFQEK